MKFFKKISFKGLLYNKKFTIALSIFLSFVLWIAVKVNKTPTMTKSFNDIGVTINMENTIASENGMSIINDIATQKFSVKVMGPNQTVSLLSAADINLYASAAQVDEPGEYKLTVSATQSTAGNKYDIVSITPKTIKVNFDYIETREFTVIPIAEGVTAPDNLIAETPVVSGLESNILEITGPRTLLNSIKTVKAISKVEKMLSATETFNADITIYNKNDRKISTENLEFGMEDIKITVPISKSKEVSVKLDYVNLPKGFDKSALKYTIDHKKITVIGKPEVVEKIKQISLSPIDITELATNKTKFELTAVLPDGVRILDNIDIFNVEFNMWGFKERTITVKNFKFSGLKKGLSVSKYEHLRNVSICGPSYIINKLNANNVIAQINLTDKKSGAHAVMATITFKDYKQVWAVGRYETSVTIK